MFQLFPVQLFFVRSRFVSVRCPGNFWDPPKAADERIFLEGTRLEDLKKNFKLNFLVIDRLSWDSDCWNSFRAMILRMKSRIIVIRRDDVCSMKKLDHFNNYYKKLCYLFQPNLKCSSLVGQQKIGQINDARIF